jgi:hypothetical protein
LAAGELVSASSAEPRGMTNTARGATRASSGADSVPAGAASAAAFFFGALAINKPRYLRDDWLRGW